jgi:hypothetical protein
MERCPDCGASVRGAQVCASCGAFDFEGVTSWVCFPCGAQNAHGESRCTCGRERTLECGACGAEVAFAGQTCAGCGVPRFAFAAAQEARCLSEEIEHLREAARTLALGLIPTACAGLLLLFTSAHPSARITGASLLALAVAGEGYALSTHRRARRQLE